MPCPHSLRGGPCSQCLGAPAQRVTVTGGQTVGYSARYIAACKLGGFKRRNSEAARLRMAQWAAKDGDK